MTDVNSQLIQEAVLKHSKEIIEWTKKLIRFPSENRYPDGYEYKAQQFIEKECKDMGLDTNMFTPEDVLGIKDHPSWLPGRKYPKERKNLVSEWKGSGKGRSILFSGHIDVAPSIPENWKICSPYKPVIKDNRLYGRGSVDMKGGITALFWALKILKDIGFKPSGDIIFESIVDEEYAGGNGTLASRLKGYNAGLAIIPEPSRMQVCPACFGAFIGDLILKGKAGMPFMGSTIPNPVDGASRVIELFQRWEKEWRSSNTHPLFNESGKELKIVLYSVDTNDSCEFIQMGTPKSIKISWIVWCYPGMTEDIFYRKFRLFWEKCSKSDPKLKPFKMEIMPTFHYVKPWETDISDPAVQTVIDSFTQYIGKSPVVGGAPFSCDLGIYGEVGGMPSILIGPRGDNLHAPDEWVLIEDILSLTGMFALLVYLWCRN